MTDPEVTTNEFAYALDVAVKAAAQRRMIAELTDRRLVDAAINQAADRIAAAFGHN